jgi:aminopeptidase N
MFRFLFLILVFAGASAGAQSIDVQHYRFELELSDASDAITGRAFITTKFLEDAPTVRFDLVSITDDKGFYAFQVKEGTQLLTAHHQQDAITITLPVPARKGEIHTYEINYMGTPKDGLIISKNKFGDRTFFADNWPNRAHQWIPCNDRPDDKASFEFIVTAPQKYGVISNGLLVGTESVGTMKRTHWKEDIALSTKVMVIGVAAFAVKTFATGPARIPVSAFIYPQDSTNGFYDYAVATEILNYFTGYIGPFPFRKLANVQSTTIFGGMENASAIFYAEESVTGDRKWEDVVAHEIVHQWFGDAASEKSFAHLWLSEGFATYLTDIYIGTKYGADSAAKRLQKERMQVIAFAQKSDRPVVDSTSPPMQLLNANSYQKGAWVLRMIHAEVGDSLFRAIIRRYYETFKGSNAETRDFEAVVETVTGKNWKAFFDQWLFAPGVPRVVVDWKAEDREIKITINQEGSRTFSFPLEYRITMSDGKWVDGSVIISGKETKIKIDTQSRPTELLLDPNTKLLFAGKIVGK